ncbi:MAG: hypothetical protein ACRDBO_19790 [Lachnospiraceae bacterium]
MNKTIKIGGVGKNPAIQKINSLNEVISQLNAGSILEKKVFCTENTQKQDLLRKRKQIIKDFSINFSKTD